MVGDTGSVSLTDAELAAELAEEAGRLLLAVREQVGHDFPYELGDAGDVAANALLLRRLRAERPNDAVLSEEADWAVHVALWQRTGGTEGKITDAAVSLPASGEVHRSDTVKTPPLASSGPIRITASSSRPPAVLWRLRDRLDIEFVRIGSAGAKAMAVVRGDVDAYIHAGGQWEWDSAAPAGVLQAAGLHATRIDGSPLRYNQRDPYLPDLLMCRPEMADLLLDAMWLAS